jgi:hypothetical protein
MLSDFIAGLHRSTKLLSIGRATVLGRTVDACLVRNLYGQEIVWGPFDCDRGKFKGKKISNNSATEGVAYEEVK